MLNLSLFKFFLGFMCAFILYYFRKTVVVLEKNIIFAIVFENMAFMIMEKSKILTGLLMAAIVLCSSCGERKTVLTKQPTRVRTEVLASTGDAGSQTYVGIVEEREATAISFTGMGVVRRVLVEEGQAVSRGQLLAEMDDTQARNLLAGAEAGMAQANDALERYSQLHDSGSLTEAQWVEIQSKVAQARSQLAVAQKNLDDCQLKAPVSGIIGRKQLVAGETARPTQAVVTILDISSVKVKVAVPEVELAAITGSTPSTIWVDAAQKQVKGGLIEKGVVADALTHTYDVRIHVPNADRKLLPGMVASVSFAASSLAQTERSTLPVTAVQRRADGSLFVWSVAADSTAHRETVAVGQTVGNRIEIVSGPDAGRRIVTEGYQKLSEGTKVIY